MSNPALTAHEVIETAKSMMADRVDPPKIAAYLAGEEPKLDPKIVKGLVSPEDWQRLEAWPTSTR